MCSMLGELWVSLLRKTKNFAPHSRLKEENREVWIAHSKLAFPSEIKRIPLTHPSSHRARANTSGYKEESGFQKKQTNHESRHHT